MSAFSQLLPAKAYKSQPESLGQDQPVYGSWAMALRNSGYGKRSLALKSTLRSEEHPVEHPVFIQPIREYVLGRCGAFCAKKKEKKTEPPLIQKIKMAKEFGEARCPLVTNA